MHLNDLIFAPRVENNMRKSRYNKWFHSHSSSCHHKQLNVLRKCGEEPPPSVTPTKRLQRLHQLDGELFPFRQLLQHFGHLVVSTPDEAMSIDRLDHVAHVDDLDLVDDAALADSLETNRHRITIPACSFLPPTHTFYILRSS